jgi:hypothetical protein
VVDSDASSLLDMTQGPGTTVYSDARVGLVFETAPSEAGDDASEDSTALADPGTASTGIDDASPGPPFDPGEGGVCPPGVNQGDLQITELMIESFAGTGDHGEWMEIQSTRSCALDVLGLHGEVPVASKIHAFDVTSDLWLPTSGTFVVADSLDPTLNHDLPGTVIAWTGQPGDVLRNKGATITLSYGGVLVSATTYPALTLVVGTSVAFPADCPPNRISDWTAWQNSTASWFPSFYGTPNAPNTDVACPQ